MDILWLYLFTRVDSLIGLFTAASIAVACVAVMTGMFGFIEDEPEALKLAKKAAVAMAIFVPLTVLIPSQRDLAIIIGGHFAYKGVTSESFQEGMGETSNKLYRLIQKELDEALEETEKTESN